MSIPLGRCALELLEAPPPLEPEYPYPITALLSSVPAGSPGWAGAKKQAVRDVGGRVRAIAQLFRPALFDDLRNRMRKESREEDLIRG